MPVSPLDLERQRFQALCEHEAALHAKRERCALRLASASAALAAVDAQLVLVSSNIEACMTELERIRRLPSGT